jgi:D-isomer specific 2-hydroxyacid dehydrogenase, NAD binding domain
MPVVMALMLALARRLPEARDNQAKRVWRGMIGDLTLGGKTLLIVGLGQIGRPACAARQGVRHTRDRHPPRPARRCRTRGLRLVRANLEKRPPQFAY